MANQDVPDAPSPYHQVRNVAIWSSVHSHCTVALSIYYESRISKPLHGGLVDLRGRAQARAGGADLHLGADHLVLRVRLVAVQQRRGQRCGKCCHQ